MRHERSLYYRRRRRRQRLRALVVLMALIIAAGAAVTMAARPDHDHPAGNTRSTAALHHRGPARPLAPRQNFLDGRAVRHVLAYTPFLEAGSRRRRAIALTFDDGPSPETPRLVTELVRLRVPATFFIVGQQLQYFSAGLRDELRHGFVIANHTQNHAWLTQLGPGGQAWQINRDNQMLTGHGAPMPRLFRPPYGGYDHATLNILRRAHMLMVLWSIDTTDWRRPGTGVIVHRVLHYARPGSVVLMHDGGGDRSQTLNAVPVIVRGLRRQGYQLVTVPQLLALDPPPHHQRLPTMPGNAGAQ